MKRFRLLVVVLTVGYSSQCKLVIKYISFTEQSNQIKSKTTMRFILLATISIIVLAAKAVEARPSRLFNIYFLEQGPYMNPKWCGDVVFEAQDEGVETPPEPTGGGRRRRRGGRFLGEKKVQTVSIMTKPQVQRGEQGDKSKTKKSRAGEFTLLRRTYMQMHRRRFYQSLSYTTGTAGSSNLTCSPLLAPRPR